MRTIIDLDTVQLTTDILEETFVCDLKKCKGSCCQSGEAGAPLSMEEINLLEDNMDVLLATLTNDGRAAVEEQGVFYLDVDGETVSTLIEDGTCAFAFKEKNGILGCSIERAFNEGLIAFNKPLSCHLFPIRVIAEEKKPLLMYERISICAPACSLGNELKVPVYQFLKEAIIRGFGTEVYADVEQAAEFWRNNKPST
jgi:hypothetical protein